MTRAEAMAEAVGDRSPDVSVDEWEDHWHLPTPLLLDRLQVQLPPRPLELWLLATSPQPQ